MDPIWPGFQRAAQGASRAARNATYRACDATPSPKRPPSRPRRNQGVAWRRGRWRDRLVPAKEDLWLA